MSTVFAEGLFNTHHAGTSKRSSHALDAAGFSSQNRVSNVYTCTEAIDTFR